MKSIVEKINESIRVNEAKNTIMGQVLAGEPQDGIEALYAAADKLESIKPAQLKRVFKDASKKELEDYTIVLQEFSAQINGIMALAEDYPEEEETYFNDLMDPDNRLENMIDNILSNGGLETADEDDEVAEIVGKVMDNFNDISKVVLGKEWA